MSTSEHIKKVDGGFASRKLWLTVFTMAIIFVTGLIAACSEGFRSCVETIVGAELGCLAAYLSANVGTKHVLGKALGAQPDPEPRPPVTNGQ